MRILYQSHQEYTVELAKLLLGSLGWAPVFWLTGPSTQRKITKNFPETKVFPYLKSVKGYVHECIRDRMPNDAPSDVVKHVLAKKDVLYSMMDRNDSGHSFQNSEKERFLLHLVKVWYNLIEHTKPAVVLFEEEPHQASDYVLYLIFKKLGKKTFMFRRAFFQDLIFATTEFENPPQKLLEAYKEKMFSRDSKLSIFLNKHFNLISDSSYDGVRNRTLWNVDQTNENQEALGKFFCRKIEEYYQKLKFALSIVNGTYDNDQKEIGKNITESNMSYFELRRIIKKTITRNAKLLDYYNDLCKPIPNKTDKFIYFPLHYQPERTTCPLGGEFTRQEKAVDYLLSSLPENWLICIKEHPRTFSEKYARYSKNYRSNQLYDYFAEHPRIRLISLQANSFELIDRSEAVVTITGTVAWESVIRGKYAMMFGFGWMRGCEGILFISTKTDIERAFETIASNIQPDIEKIKFFASALESISFNGAVGGASSLKHKGISVEENAQVHFDALKNIT